MTNTIYTPRTKRYREQRWLTDLAILTAGPEWDQPRIDYVTGPMGSALSFERNYIMKNLISIDSFVPVFTRLAERRERKAEEEAKNHKITARDNYLAASLLYGAAVWPIWVDNDPTLLELEEKKNFCYDRYIEFAHHKIERIKINHKGKQLDGLLHYPSNAIDEDKVQCLVAIPGMDSFKETLVSEYGDKMLSRGVAVLAIDGPGQGSAIARNIKVRNDSFDNIGKDIFTFITRQREINSKSVAFQGISMGSYWALRAVSKCSDYVAVSSYASCFEPGMETIFNYASPTFKERFMWMAGYEDEEKFNTFMSKMTLEGVVDNIKCPTLLTVGSNDHLSPLNWAYWIYDKLKVRKTLDIYLGEKHRVNHPDADNRRADWIYDRLCGKDFNSSISEISPA